MKGWGVSKTGEGSSAEHSRRDFKVDAIIAEKLADLKKYQKDDKGERLIAINIKTGAIIYDAVGGGKIIDASRDMEDDPKPLGPMRNFTKLPRRVVLDIHTHPDDSCFSDLDWGSFMWDQLVESIVVTDDAVYTIRKKADFQKMKPALVMTRYRALADSMKGTTKEVTVAVSRRLSEELGVSFHAEDR